MKKLIFTLLLFINTCAFSQSKEFTRLFSTYDMANTSGELTTYNRPVKITFYYKDEPFILMELGKDRFMYEIDRVISDLYDEDLGKHYQMLVKDQDSAEYMFTISADRVSFLIPATETVIFLRK